VLHRGTCFLPSQSVPYYEGNESLSLEDWLDTSKWFDIKLLVDTNATTQFNTDIMSSHPFAKKLGEALNKLQLSSEKILHLGRKLGPKILELLNENSEEIRRMGN
jgi:predicted HAD superfamily phosphohydrolase YqeG